MEALKRKLLIILLLVLLILPLFKFNNQTIKDFNIGNYPNNWFFQQRAFPQGDINYEVYQREVIKTGTLKKHSKYSDESWFFAGPTNIGGRLTDVEMSAESFDIIYIGAASGGVFKSIDRGKTWTPIFDNEITLSIGDLAIDPTDSKIIYVGTGEVNCGGGSLTYGGSGIYKSADGGETWTHLGLSNTRYIARIVIDPVNPQNIYVAAMGKLFAENSDRGLYRSNDGGQTWEKILYISEKTGCIDVAINPESPSKIFAVMWERIRKPGSRSYGGAESGIYKSVDRGNSWVELTNGLPNNSSEVGRIGISMCESNPSVIYALYADDVGYFKGVYKSTNEGETWQQTNDWALGHIFNYYGWWFGNIRVDPFDPDIVFILGLYLHRTSDGGQSWVDICNGIHVDQHGMYIHPRDPSFIALGNDGGFYISEDGGFNWLKSNNTPITQFYTCEIDNINPERIYGGTQDNGVIRTLTGNCDDWSLIMGGDGFQVLVDPTNSDYIYAERQWGYLRRSVDGGINFSGALVGIDAWESKNWNSPVAMDPSNPQILYFGTSHVYRSNDYAYTWKKISPNLTDGPYDGNIIFGTITTIAVAPSNSSTIYAGTDDGNVWVTLDGGSNWNKISDTLPVRWITRLAVDPDDNRTAYVTFSGYREDDYLSHIFKTSDAGNNWESIAGNLPEVPLNDIIVDPRDNSTLYVASDAGVFISQNLGVNWHLLGTGLPNVPVCDLDIHNSTRILLAATYGRSMYKFDLTKVADIGVDEQVLPADEFELKQNYPNPFNAVTNIKYRISKPAHVILNIYNSLGQKIRTLVNGNKSPGVYMVRWDGTNDYGTEASSGVYICKLITDTFSESRKIVYLK